MGPMGGIGGSVGTKLTTSMGGVGRTDHYQHSHQDPLLVHKAYTITAPSTDNTVLFHAYHKSNKHTILQWCELEYDHDGQSNGSSNKDIPSLHPGDTRTLVNDIEASNMLHSEHSLPKFTGENGNAGMTAHDHPANKILRILWEVNLPWGAMINTEPHNNDGQDSRKLCYVVWPQGKVQIFNVNGRICEYNVQPILIGG